MKMLKVMKRNNQELVVVVVSFLLFCQAGIGRAQHAVKNSTAKQPLSDFGLYQQKALACSLDSLADTTGAYKICFNYRVWFTEHQGQKWLASHGNEVLPSNMAGPVQAYRLLWHGYELEHKTDTTALPLFLTSIRPHLSLAHHHVYSYGKRYVIITGDATYTLVGNDTRAGYFNTYYLEKTDP